MNAQLWKDLEYTIPKPVNGHASREAIGTTKPSKKSEGRWREFGRLVEEIGPALKPTEFQLCCVIFKRADSKTRLVKISHQTLGQLVGLQKRQVIRLIESLEDKKLIEVVKRGCSLTHEANVYRYVW